MSRANSLRAYAEQLLESDNTTLADEEISGLVDDLIEFAEQWESELDTARKKVKELLVPAAMTETMADQILHEIFGPTIAWGKLDAAGILIRPHVKVD